MGSQCSGCPPWWGFHQLGENQIPMERNEFGVWEVFTRLAQEGQIYKYHITRANGHQLMKIDPLAVRYEARPGTGAILTDIPEKKWKGWALVSS